MPSHRDDPPPARLALPCSPPAPPPPQLWRKFLPHTSVSYLEYNASCAESFRPAIEATGGRVYVGSQDDLGVLRSVVGSGQRFDVVIDDGRHLPSDQIISLRGLWPALKSGPFGLGACSGQAAG